MPDPTESVQPPVQPSVPPPVPPAASQALQRRGLLAAVAGLVAGLLAKLTAAPARAWDNEILTLGNSFGVTRQTSIFRNNPGVVEVTWYAHNTNGIGVRGDSVNSIGVQGIGADRGVYGESFTGGVGVEGRSVTNAGVYGWSSSYPGVWGVSTTHNGVQGVSSQAYGAAGDSNSSSGVYGHSNTQFGLFGQSESNWGVAGECRSAAAFGIYGVGPLGGVWGNSYGSGTGVRGTSATGIGVYGQAPMAGKFDGQVIVNGNFSATGTKSALVPHPDGAHRRLYYVESPESWFEDFGEAQLARGQATVALDPEFAAIVHADSYHVFLTEYESHSALYVVERTPTAFTVKAQVGDGANGRFSYRVVAKRKDVEGPRLERVSLPELALVAEPIEAPPPLPAPADHLATG